MKRTTRRTGRQLALVLQKEHRTAWPTETQEALIAALADLLLEALESEEASRLAGGHDERED